MAWPLLADLLPWWAAISPWWSSRLVRRCRRRSDLWWVAADSAQWMRPIQRPV